MSHGLKNNATENETAAFSNRKPFLLLRARIVQSIRAFFTSRDYLEIETPQLITAPAPETHIESISVGRRYLQTSPELCMKRLVAQGFHRIFQIARCFREGERGDLHLPEFSLLEWYRTGIDYHDLMAECEALFQFLARQLGLGTRLQCRGSTIDLSDPWQRLTVEEAFEQFAPVSLDQALMNNDFDRIIVNHVEPHLGMKTPTFLCDYPATMAALARLKPENPSVAERFEIYVAGIELANGFSELNDAREQRLRFEKELKQRTSMGKRVSPMPENFLKALSKMPDTAGIALGLDRLVMIFGDAPTIDDVVSFTPGEV
jgi:lysyl-tRNA synthetase class 2